PRKNPARPGMPHSQRRGCWRGRSQLPPIHTGGKIRIRRKSWRRRPFLSDRPEGKKSHTMPAPMIGNAGAMSEFVTAFDVPSKLTGQSYHCRFSHLWSGVATRHSDTIDTKFFVDGRGVVVGLAHTAF